MSPSDAAKDSASEWDHFHEEYEPIPRESPGCSATGPSPAEVNPRDPQTIFDFLVELQGGK